MSTNTSPMNSTEAPSAHQPEAPAETPIYDVAIAGGGPGGLSAALMLGRARRRVLLLDAGVPRNQRAQEVHGFVTQDGTSPSQFRSIAHQQLEPYRSVIRSSQRVEFITGEIDDFQLRLQDGSSARARRILLALGMVDVLPEVPGYRELWGHSVFQCPYCHAWEVQDQPFGFLAPDAEKMEFGTFLRNWTSDVMVFTEGRYQVPAATRQRLETAGVRIEERAIRALLSTPTEDSSSPRLRAIELGDGTQIERQVLFARPPQKQTALVASLGLTQDAEGFVQVDPKQETSRRGIYAAGDMTTPMQAAMVAAAGGHRAAAMLVHDLTYTPPVAAGVA